MSTARPDPLKVIIHTPVAKWRFLAVLDLPDENRLVTRGELSRFLSDNDLGVLARSMPRTPFGTVLVLEISAEESPRWRVLGGSTPEASR